MTTKEEKAPTFQECFSHVLEHAALIYDSHIQKKKDTWKTEPIEYLENSLEKEIAEYHSAWLVPREVFREALDIVNFALMIAARKLKEIRY